MPADLLLRPASTHDIEAIQRVARASWHAAYDDIIGADAVDQMLDEWYEDAAIEAGVTHEAQDFFVAVLNEELVGFVHVGPHPPRRVHQVYRLYVHPDEWRQGIGRQLLGEIEEELYERDVHFYEAEVMAENETAIAFYESTGFEQVDERDTDLAGVTVDELIFRKRL